jgi:hypothetical protein
VNSSTTIKKHELEWRPVDPLLVIGDPMLHRVGTHPGTTAAIGWGLLVLILVGCVFVSAAALRGQSEAQVIRQALADAVRRPRPRPGLLEAEPIAERAEELLHGFDER